MNKYNDTISGLETTSGLLNLTLFFFQLGKETKQSTHGR